MDAPDWLRSAGGVLQVVGVLTVAYELHSAHRRYLKTPTLIDRLTAWFRRLRRRTPRETHVAIGAATADAATARGLGYVPGDPADMSPDEQRAELFRRLDQLREQLRDLRTRVNEERTERGKAVQKLRTSLAASEQRLEASLKELATGNLRLRWWGVAMLVTGIPFATWPQEMARLSGLA